MELIYVAFSPVSAGNYDGFLSHMPCQKIVEKKELIVNVSLESYVVMTADAILK